MLDEQERQERDPAAIQRELLDIEKELCDVSFNLQERARTLSNAKLNYDLLILHQKRLKDSKSLLQSVLKSVSMV